jgi:hypothetical protein
MLHSTQNHAFVNTKKHHLFYNKVVQNGWESFQLSILTIIPDYCIEFAKIYPEYIISKKDILILSDLVSLELTIAVRSQKPEARSQKPEARSQKPEARSQKPEARSQKPKFI